MLVPGWNFIQLMGLPGSYQEAREKQLHCFQLAFIRTGRNEFANDDARRCWIRWKPKRSPPFKRLTHAAFCWLGRQ